MYNIYDLLSYDLAKAWDAADECDIVCEDEQLWFAYLETRVFMERYNELADSVNARLTQLCNNNVIPGEYLE